MTTLPASADVIATHDAALAVEPAPSTATDLRAWIATNHFHNRRLWAHEDLARRTRVPDADIVANKRAIDRHNQARNDAVERIDELLIEALDLAGAEPQPGARLNSETAGAMLDRMSILSLKIAAMHEQTQRTDATPAHREACSARLQRLQLQRADLGGCLDELLADALAGRAWFKVYRQFKMYNDPQLNPALAAESR